MSDSQAFNHLLNDCLESETEKDPPPPAPCSTSSCGMAHCISTDVCVWGYLTAEGAPNKRLLQMYGPWGWGQEEGRACGRTWCSWKCFSLHLPDFVQSLLECLLLLYSAGICLSTHFSGFSSYVCSFVQPSLNFPGKVKCLPWTFLCFLHSCIFLVV